MVLAENARCTFKIKFWDHHRVLGFDYVNLFVVSFKSEDAWDRGSPLTSEA